MERIKEYLERADQSRLDEDQAETLEGPITEEEFSMAVKCLAVGKAPCPDGLTGVYFKQFMELLARHFATMFNTIKTPK